MALFRVDFSGRGELADRQQKLAQMLSRLQKISEGEEARGMLCECRLTGQSLLRHMALTCCVWGGILSITEYNVAVMITNQMTADPGGE